MVNFSFINHIEERNGLAEAIWLLEDRLRCEEDDSQTVMRLLFLYWYMWHEPFHLTNDRRDRNWLECFDVLLAKSTLRFANNVDYNWVIGYLLTQVADDGQRTNRGIELIQRAAKLAPSDPLPGLALKKALDLSCSCEVISPEGIDRLLEWGMLGEFFVQLFSSHN